jgi:hypothetical protein
VIYTTLHIQAIGSLIPNHHRARRRRPLIVASISIHQHKTGFVWSLTLYRDRRIIAAPFGELNKDQCKSIERSWLYAMAQAFEWRDKHVPKAKSYLVKQLNER